MSDVSLVDLAYMQVELADRMCPDACRDYHAAWPVLRAAGLVGGIDADRRPFLEMLGPLFLTGDVGRILIAGCADSALLSLIAGLAPASSRITIVDRCPTPLAVCRRVAGPGLQLTTLQGDLLSCEPDAPYDLIVCHSLLPFLGDSERRDLLRRFASWLAPRGSLVLAVRLKRSQDRMDMNQTGRWVATRAAEAGKALAGRLPGEALGAAWSARQDERLEGFYRFMATQNLPYARAEDAVDEFRDAGLSVTTILSGGEGLSFMTADWRSQRSIPGLVLQAVPSEPDPGRRGGASQEDSP